MTHWIPGLEFTPNPQVEEMLAYLTYVLDSKHSAMPFINGCKATYYGKRNLTPRQREALSNIYEKVEHNYLEDL